MKKMSALLAACLICPGLYALTVEELGERLQSLSGYSAAVDYDILISSMPDAVDYALTLESAAAPGDTLSPCNYLIRWNLEVGGKRSEGFSAYYDGNHFRYRSGTMMQEYHAEWTPEVFVPSGGVGAGVQRQAQFADLLPQMIGTHILDMASDSTYIFTFTPDKAIGTRRCAVIEGTRRIQGYDASEYTYTFDATTLLPEKIEIENNPGQIGEQSITVTYSDSRSDVGPTIDMDRLRLLEPEAFEKYRQSTYSIETLPGRRLPRISAPTIGGERYLHSAGEPMGAPTVIAFVDAGVGSTPAVMSTVRSALGSLPMQTDIVWAFVNHRTDDIAPLVSDCGAGESVLVSARSAARECGIGAVTPVLIFVSASGEVADVQIGDNQSLAELVIQKAGIAAIK